jgi:hypothetical protein
MDGKPGESLKEVWVYLSDEEALELLEALNDYKSGPTSPVGTATSRIRRATS